MKLQSRGIAVWHHRNAGDPPDRARYYPKDDEYLLTRPEKVKHYEAYGELMQVGGTAA